MRVLHVVRWMGLGGAERIAFDLACGSQEEQAVFTCYPPTGTEVEERTRTRLVGAGVAVFVPTGTRARRRAGSQPARRQHLLSALELSRALASFAPDIVQLHTEIPEATWMVNRLVSRWRPVRPIVIRTIHNTRIWPEHDIVRRVADRVFANATWVSVSRDVAQHLRRRPDGRTVTIENGVALSRPRERQRRRPGPVRLLFAGRLERAKGVDVLVEALHLLEGEGLQLSVSVVGAGSQREQLAEASRALTTIPVVLSGPVPEMSAVYEAHDALLLPSRHEGLSLQLLEAAARSLPVIGSDAPGMLYPDGHPRFAIQEGGAGLAALIRLFLRDPSSWAEHTAAFRTMVEERHSLPLMMAQYEELWRSLAMYRRPPRS